MQHIQINPRLQAIIRQASNADVVGIGEHNHGELTSWKFRYAIIKGLIDLGKHVVVLCENLETYVQNITVSPSKLTRKNGYFEPNLMIYSDRSEEHMVITREFVKLKGAEFHGIDIQILKFPALWRLVKSRPLRRILSVHKDTWLRGNMVDGKLRNNLNAEIIMDFLAMSRAKDPNSVVVYLAHNEHVALSCRESRVDPLYRVEGSLLAKSPIKYLAVGTYSPFQYSMMGRMPRQQPVLSRGGGACDHSSG